MTPRHLPRRFPAGLSPRRQHGLLLLVAALAAAVWHWWHPAAQQPAPQSLPEGVYQVKRVVDGDTLLLTNGCRVRLIGADTPETVKPDHPVEPWGPEATQFTRQFIGHGEVRLQFDRERIDKYGRLLAYVWVGKRMLNEELIRAGLARAEPQYHYSKAMKDRFLAAQMEARAARRGIWSKG